jgi:4-hydroxybenzoate polyprenyltransferase
MVDRDDDIKIGIRTSALAFGRFDVIAVMCCYAIYFAILAGVGWSIGLGYWFAVGLLAAVACSVYHYFLIRHRDRDACFKAFQHNNWLGCFVFIGLVLDFTFSH